MSTLADYLIQTALTLIALITLGVLAFSAARRLNPRVPNSALQLVGHLPLDAKRAVYLVRVGERVLILGASEAGLTALGDTAAGAFTDLPSSPRRFRDVLFKDLLFKGVAAQQSGNTPDASAPQKGDNL